MARCRLTPPRTPTTRRGKQPPERPGLASAGEHTPRTSSRFIHRFPLQRPLSWRLAHRTDAPDRPAGVTCDLDGRFVTDVEGFYCAIGEAINGPGGYFGWNLDALDDCLSGRFGAQTPFRLVWHDSAVAREHLVTGYDRRLLGPATTLEYLLDMLAAHQVEIDLR
ncbi:barstar family protein [Micromonospora haikouensis]|uniref:barstar family protein n=1 Tax=Micromonospora haikouensis TaxID=686309 RepID=UPI0033CE5B85